MVFEILENLPYNAVRCNTKPCLLQVCSGSRFSQKLKSVLPVLGKLQLKVVPCLWEKVQNFQNPELWKFMSEKLAVCLQNITNFKSKWSIILDKLKTNQRNNYNLPTSGF